MIDIDLKKELFVWGPLDGKLLYTDFFTHAFTKFPKLFYPWPNCVGFFFKEKVVFIVDFFSLRQSGKKNFKKFILNDRNFNKYYKIWTQQAKEILDFQKQVMVPGVDNLTDSELAAVYKKWLELLTDFWVISLMPELANWGGEVILKDSLEKKVSGQDFISTFEKLSAPENLSFYPKAERDLLKLKKFVKDKKLFEKKLDEHHKKYFWILNSYHGSRVLSKKYFQKELSSFSLQKANQKIKEIEFFPQRIKQEKAEVIKKYKLGTQIAKIAKRLSFCIWWQDYRKYYIFLGHHQLDVFLKELAKRTMIDFDDLHYYNHVEILSLMTKKKKISNQKLIRRRSNLVIYYNNNSLQYISGLPAKKIISKFLKPKAINYKSIKEFKGLVVSQGKKIKGKARIINSPKEASKMKKGDVLIAATIQPDYILAMKKASAIITDRGGMTCHAAIVSRELEIPCIVATKIATQVLKDDDLIEVDTSKGIVKKLK